MKQWLIVSLLSVTLWADGLNWGHDLHHALEVAKKENKPIMMMYSAPWCPECNYMKEVVFNDKALSEYMKEHFILLSYDIDADKERLPQGFSYMGIPTFFFIDHKRNEIEKIEGGSRAKVFLKKLGTIK